MRESSSGARFEYLVWIDGEVLAKHRQRARGTRLLHVIQAALEKLLVRQHRQAGGAIALIARGNHRRLERLSQQAAAGARLLHLRDHRRAAGGELRA